MKLEAEPGGQVQQPAPGRPGWGWQKAQGTGAIGLLALFALAMARFGVDPFFLIMAAPFVVALLLRLRFRRTGTVLIGVFSVALFAMNAGFVIDEIQHPEAGFDFIFPTGFTLALLIGIITAVPAYREVRRGRSGSAAPKAIPAAALVLLIAFVGWGLAANAAFESASAQAGDVVLVQRDFEFAPETIEAAGGEVSFFVDNKDSALHTFTIDELGVDVTIPGGKSARVSFRAEPGKTYRFYCKPHQPDMDGSLAVK